MHIDNSATNHHFQYKKYKFHVYIHQCTYYLRVISGGSHRDTNPFHQTPQKPPKIIIQYCPHRILRYQTCNFRLSEGHDSEIWP